MSALPKFSPQEYLEQERRSAGKSEYIAGEIYAMSGGSPAHNLIGMNIGATLHNQLKQRPCRVYTSDQRVRVGDGYLYPDVSVACGKPIFADKDNLANPILLVEVLSPSSEDYDTGGKFARYRQIESLQEYLTVAQDRFHLAHYARQADNRWLLTEYADAQAVVELTGIGCVLAMADVYGKVFE
jgi:Uma2 family endonuclease